MKKEIIFTPEQMNTFTNIPFDVPANTRELRILFSYDPHWLEKDDFSAGLVKAKLDEFTDGFIGERKLPESVRRKWESYRQRPEVFLPLRNQLKFSLYGPKGEFRGRWDSPQYFNEWVTIGPVSSRGFFSQFLPEGQWTAEIETHGVFSQEVVASIEIETVQSQRKKRWYAGELHSHTNHSDGDYDLVTVVNHAHNIGLDFMVLTDHNTTSALADIKSDLPIKVIRGLELSSYFGHLVVSGISHYIDWRVQSNKDTLDSVLDEVDKQGALATIAHPFVPGPPICCGCEWEYTNANISRIDAMEIWSGPWEGAKTLHNWRALLWWDELLNQGHRITGVAARDVHNKERFYNPNSANTYVLASSLETGELLDGIKQGRVFLSSGPQLELEAACGKGVYAMGDTVPCSNDSKVELTVGVTEAEEPLVLQVVADGEVVHESKVESLAGKETVTLARPQRWLRVQYVRETLRDQFVLIGNPIYFVTG